MIDFELSLADLQSAVTLMTEVRKSRKNDTLDLTCAGTSVRFVTLGREFSAEANIAAKGQSRIPLTTFARLAELAQSYGKPFIRLRIETGQIRVQTMSLKDDAVTVGAITDRPVDVPDDAPALDLLALKMLFSPKELRESDLSDRVATAEKHRVSDLVRAAEVLEKYGIVAATLEKLVAQSISSNAVILEPILKPAVRGKHIQ